MDKEIDLSVLLFDLRAKAIIFAVNREVDGEKVIALLSLDQLVDVLAHALVLRADANLRTVLARQLRHCPANAVLIRDVENKPFLAFQKHRSIMGDQIDTAPAALLHCGGGP